MPVGSPQRRPQRRAGAPLLTGRPLPPNTRATCARVRTIVTLSAAAAKGPLGIALPQHAGRSNPAPSPERVAKGWSLQSPYLCIGANERCLQVYSGPPLRRPQRDRKRLWSSRPPAPVVLAPTRSNWPSRPPAQLTARDSLLARGHAAHSSNSWAVGHPFRRRSSSLRHSGQIGVGHHRRRCPEAGISSRPARAMPIVLVAGRPGRGAQSQACRPQPPRRPSSPIAKSSRAPHHCNGRGATRATAENAQHLCAIEASTTKHDQGRAASPMLRCEGDDAEGGG